MKPENLWKLLLGRILAFHLCGSAQQEKTTLLFPSRMPVGCKTD
jgi:hypothetical protein